MNGLEGLQLADLQVVRFLPVLCRRMEIAADCRAWLVSAGRQPLLRKKGSGAIAADRHQVVDLPRAHPFDGACEVACLGRPGLCGALDDVHQARVGEVPEDGRQDRPEPLASDFRLHDRISWRGAPKVLAKAKLGCGHRRSVVHPNASQASPLALPCAHPNYMEGSSCPSRAQRIDHEEGRPGGRPSRTAALVRRALP
jgi:hypothetical protein